MRRRGTTPRCGSAPAGGLAAPSRHRPEANEERRRFGGWALTIGAYLGAVTGLSVGSAVALLYGATTDLLSAIDVGPTIMLCTAILGAVAGALSGVRFASRPCGR